MGVDFIDVRYFPSEQISTASRRPNLLERVERGGYASAVTLFALMGSATAFAQQSDRPNVVFILADNVGYGDLGSYGGGELRGAHAALIPRAAFGPRGTPVTRGP
jgi:hypothetical protein